jgi:thiosulfate/3-mercaptopyruvate sulfurtransferase
MTHQLLISAAELQTLVDARAPLRIFDCSFDLGQPHLGEQQYAKAHIPGAVYANLDTDLSAQHGAPGFLGSDANFTAMRSIAPAGHAEGVVNLDSDPKNPTTGADAPASGGRHPLPNLERFATWLSSIGLANDMQAVVYDQSGSMYAGRLWWMLKWAGHTQVALLDGGWAAWQAAGGAVAQGHESPHFQTNYVLAQSNYALAATKTVADQLGKASQTLLDARGAARYLGQVEPLDPVAGHIPGALNRPFTENFTANGQFKPPEQLRAEFEQLLAGRDPQSVVQQCGSGVTATVNLLAMELAGFGPTPLYAGSWSEWCSDAARPMVRG